MTDLIAFSTNLNKMPWTQLMLFHLRHSVFDGWHVFAVVNIGSMKSFVDQFFVCVFCVFFWCLRAQFFLTSLIYRWLITYGEVRTHEMCWDTCMLIEFSPKLNQTKLFAKLMNFPCDSSSLRVKIKFIHSTSANLLRSNTSTSTRTNAKLFEFVNQKWWP